MRLPRPGDPHAGEGRPALGSAAASAGPLRAKPGNAPPRVIAGHLQTVRRGEGVGAGMLILGTAQFGMEYGVANRTGRPDLTRTKEILDHAFAHGLRYLDTAMNYDRSEAMLGHCGVDGWNIITKLPSLSGLPEKSIEDAARVYILRSLDRLRTTSLHAVLAHDHRDLRGSRGQRVIAALQTMRHHGLVDRIGVSVYGPEDIDGLDPAATGIVQAPLNVLDQRILRTGLADRLHRQGSELHVRSVFLQGLLLMPARHRPARFKRWSAEMARVTAYACKTGLDPLAFCLGFVTQQKHVAHCVVGVEQREQLVQILDAYEAGSQTPVDADELHAHDPHLIDPRLWTAGA